MQINQKLKDDIEVAKRGKRWPQGKKPQYIEVFDQSGIMVELFKGGMLDYPRPSGHQPKYTGIYYEGNLVYFDIWEGDKNRVLLNLVSG
jgi:hypothetical protein